MFILFYYNNEFGFRFSFHRNSATVNVTSDATTEVPNRVNELDFEVLHLLKENPVYTREEIAQKVVNSKYEFDPSKEYVLLDDVVDILDSWKERCV